VLAYLERGKRRLAVLLNPTASRSSCAAEGSAPPGAWSSRRMAAIRAEDRPAARARRNEGLIIAMREGPVRGGLSHRSNRMALCFFVWRILRGEADTTSSGKCSRSPAAGDARVTTALLALMQGKCSQPRMGGRPRCCPSRSRALLRPSVQAAAHKSLAAGACSAPHHSAKSRCYAAPIALIASLPRTIAARRIIEETKAT